MTFEEWYETYDRDGGELMLFNTMDLEAAWNSAQEAAARRCAELCDRAVYEQNIETEYGTGKAFAYADIADTIRTEFNIN